MADTVNEITHFSFTFFFITQSRAKLQIKTYIPISEQNLPFHKKVKIIL